MHASSVCRPPRRKARAGQEYCDLDLARAGPRTDRRAGAARRSAGPRSHRSGPPLQRVRPPGPEADVGRGLHLPQHRGGPDPGGAAAGHGDHRRGAAARRGGGLRRPPGGHRARVRRRDRRHRGRAHQDLQPHLPQHRRRAGGELPEAAALHRQGRAGHHHQAGRPAAQHADPGAPLARAAAAHRHRDAGDLRPAGAPVRHGGHQGGAGGPRLQVPGAGGLSRPGQPGGRQARGAGADHPQAARAARGGAQARGDRVVRGHRPTQAPLVHLPEDAEAEQGLRRDLRPDGHPGHRPHRPRVLPRARRDPPQLDPDPGADQGLHREPQVERLPVAPHHDLRPRRPALRGADPHPGDAPDGRVRYRGPLALQAGRQGGRAGPAPGLVPPAHRAAAGHPQPRGVPRVPEGRPLPGRDLHFHAARAT